MLRSRPMRVPKNSSATATVLPAGALMIAIPSSVASSTSMLSTPTPARPTTASRGAARSNSGEIRVALLPTRASYVPMRASSSSRGSVGTSSTASSGSAARRATPSASMSSVIRMRYGSSVSSSDVAAAGLTASIALTTSHCQRLGRHIPAPTWPRDMNRGACLHYPDAVLLHLDRHHRRRPLRHLLRPPAGAGGLARTARRREEPAHRIPRCPGTCVRVEHVHLRGADPELAGCDPRDTSPAGPGGCRHGCLLGEDDPLRVPRAAPTGARDGRDASPLRRAVGAGQLCRPAHRAL